MILKMPFIRVFPVASKKFLKMGEEVSSLKKEVIYLHKSLQNYVHHHDILKSTLYYSKEDKESELLKQSIEHKNSRDAIVRQLITSPKDF